MSNTRPSAFDVLMSNSSKKKQQRQQTTTKPSPNKKNKYHPTALLMTTQNLNSNPNVPAENVAAAEEGNDDQLLANKDLNNLNEEEADSNNIRNKSMKKISGDIRICQQKVNSSISPDESLVELKNKAASFDVKKATYWDKGEKVPFMFVVKALDVISRETGRIAINEIVCNMLRTVIDTTPDDLVAVVYLLANRIAAAHEGLELGIGDASIIKALAEACGVQEAHIEKQYTDLGDLGLVAKASRSSQSLLWKPEPLTVAKVFDTFHLIAKESGKDSQDKKKNHIKGLLVAATDCEPQYLIRLLQVWEVKAADLTISPVYHAAIGTVDPNKGISLRLPHLVRVRDDKNPEQASSSDMIAEMYNAQKNSHCDK